MSDFNVFELLNGPNPVAIHNVRLVDMQPADAGRSRLTVERDGQTAELLGAAPVNDWSRRDIGAWGYVVPMRRVTEADWQVPRGACVFHPYLEPSLRRVPERDIVETNGERPQLLAGWRTDARPLGFLVPAHLIPGEEGAYVRDETVEVVLRVPPEFLRECRRVQHKPEDVLRGFIADVAEIRDEMRRPRADGYSSNGSDERELAAAWLDRAYGLDAIDIDAAEAADAEREERADRRDEFGQLLDDYVDEGGQVDQLMRLVEAEVKKQRQAAAGGAT